MAEMKKVLFLCTGNYYRSRFAEELFNHLARERGLGWRAESRGLNVEYGRMVNTGSFSAHAEEGLKARGVRAAGRERMPAQVRDKDVAECEVIIAIKEAEHRPLIEDKHKYAWAPRVEYWGVHDLDAAEPKEALQELEGKVRELIERLGGAGGLARDDQA